MSVLLAKMTINISGYYAKLFLSGQTYIAPLINEIMERPWLQAGSQLFYPGGKFGPGGRLEKG